MTQISVHRSADDISAFALTDPTSSAFIFAKIVAEPSLAPATAPNYIAPLCKRYVIDAIDVRV